MNAQTTQLDQLIARIEIRMATLERSQSKFLSDGNIELAALSSIKLEELRRVMQTISDVAEGR